MVGFLQSGKYGVHWYHTCVSGKAGRARLLIWAWTTT